MFVMIFDALSNDVYRVSLHGSRAELDGGVQTPPPRRIRRRAAARRGLRYELVTSFSINALAIFEDSLVVAALNPRTNGGLGQLRADAGGTDNSPPEILKKTKQARDKR